MLGAFKRPTWQMQELEPRCWLADLFLSSPLGHVYAFFSPQGQDLKFYILTVPKGVLNKVSGQQLHKMINSGIMKN